MPIDTSMYQNLVPAQPPGNAFERFMGRQQKQADFAAQQQEHQLAQQKLAQEQQAQAAMLRLSNPETAQGFQPTNYAEVLAMQAHAKQTLDAYTPMLAAAVKDGNYALRDAISDRLEKSGNPMLAQFGAVARTAKKIDNETYGYDIAFTSPEQRQAAYDSDPFLRSTYPDVNSIPLGVVNHVETKGLPGEPGSRIHKFTFGKPEKTTEEKPHYDTTTIKDIADVESLMSQLDPKDPKSPWVRARLEKAIKDNPGKEVRARMEGTKPTGLFDVTAPPKDPAAGGGSSDSGGEFPVIKYNDPGHYYGSLFKKSGGEQEFATLVSRFLSASVGGRNAFQAVGLSAGKQNDKKREEFLARVSDFMEQRGITQADVTTAEGARKAIGQIQKQQSMMEQNAAVAEKGFEMVSELRKNGKISTGAVPLLNQAENLLRTWTGDAMPGAAQGILTETLMDYAKVVSGQTSTAGVTMYAAKIAKELLELKDNPAQFQKKVDQYRKLMATRLSSGKAAVRGLGEMSDVGSKGKAVAGAPSLDDYIKKKVVKFPQYKNKARAEWEAAYNREFGGVQ